MTVLTALQIVQDACSQMGQSEPNSLTSSSDKGVKQLLGLLNKEGRALSARWAWQVMTWEVTFVTNGLEDQGSILTMVDAIDQTWRYVLDDTMYNRTTRLPVFGPLSPLEYQLAKSLNFNAGPFPQYRIDKNRILLFPIAPAAQTIAFEFVSRSWLTNQTGAFKERVDKDDDLIVLDTDLVTLGLIWRWRRAKELDYAEEFAEYERMVDDAISRDKSAKKLRLDGGGSFPRGVVAPAGSWNLPNP